MAAKRASKAVPQEDLSSLDQLWKVRRATTGRPRKVLTPEDLMALCCEYFSWCDEHPLRESKLVTYQGDSSVETVPKLRAYTLGGLCLYLGISHQTWMRYRLDGEEDSAETGGETFRSVCSWADTAIREQKFTGAAADMLNPVIIARDLGLKDSVHNEHTSPDGTMTPGTSRSLSDDELKKELERRGLPANLLDE